MECTMQILEITAQSTRFTRLQRLWEILAAFKGFGKGAAAHVNLRFGFPRPSCSPRNLYDVLAIDLSGFSKAFSPVSVSGRQRRGDVPGAAMTVSNKPAYVHEVTMRLNGLRLSKFSADALAIWEAAVFA